MDKQKYMQEIAEHFGSGLPISMGWIMIAVGLVMLLIAALSIRHWWKTRHDRPTPLLTFFLLARQLGLAKADQWLLLRISRQQQLPSPITLMLSAGTLNWYGRAYAATLHAGRRDKLQGHLDRIAATLFEGASSGEG